MVSREATGRTSFQCKRTSTSTAHSSEEAHSKRPAEENPSTSATVDSRVSIPAKRVRVDLSDDGEYDSSQEDKQPVPSYSDTLFCHQKMVRYCYH